MKDKNLHKIFNLTPLLLLIWGLISLFFFEKIPLNNGFGWDGRLYGQLAMDFENMIRNCSLEAYSVQRIFPSFLIYYILKIFQLPHSINNVINGFQIYSLISIVVCSYLWIAISKISKMSIEVKLLGFILLFINYPFLKGFYYYPVTTDFTAILIGFVSLYAALKGNLFIQIGVLIIAYFTWPAAIIISIIFILFPINTKEQFDFKNKPDWLNYFFTGFYSIVFIAFLIYVVFFVKYKIDKSFFWYLNLFFSAILMSFFAILISISFLIKIPFTLILKKVFRRNFIFKFLSILFILFILSWIKSFLYNVNAPVNFNVLQLFINIFIYGLELPFKFIVAHIVYWGPSFLLFLLFYKRVYNKIFEFGLGMIMIVLYSTLFGLCSESRILLNLYPILIFLLLTAIDLNQIKNRRILFLFIIVISILLSKVWLPINLPSVWVAGQTDFPFQRYFMQHGPWMSDIMYVIHLLFSLFVFVCFLFFFKIKKTDFNWILLR